MIRGGLPFAFMLLLLIFFWALFSVLIEIYATKIRKQYVKIAGRAFLAAVASLILILLAVNAVAVFFN